MIKTYSAFYALLYYNVTKDYVLVLGSFGPSNYSEAMQSLLGALKIVKNDTGSRLLINIASNPGGEPEVSSLLAHAIYPEMFPMYPKMV